MKDQAVMFHGVLVQQTVLLLPPLSPAAFGQFVVSGFTWWQLIGARFVLNNIAGAVNATGQVFIQLGSQFLVGCFVGSAVAPGTSGDLRFGLNVSTSNDLVGSFSASLPDVPIAGDATIVWGFADGDANTVVTSASLVIVGHRRENIRGG